MASILVTGMTGSHTSIQNNRRTRGMAGQIVDTLTKAGHAVTWRHISTTYDLSGFDSVLVGISPILALGSIHAYGPLSRMSELMSENRVRFFIDAPAPSQIAASLRSIEKVPERAIKPLFSVRSGWADSSLDVLLEGVSSLLELPWPPTAIPVLPWRSDYSKSLKSLPSGCVSSVRPLSLDAIENLSMVQSSKPRMPFWAADNLASSWTKKMQSNSSYMVAPMKGSKFASDLQVRQFLVSASGALIAPQRDGTTWWTPRYLHALTSGTPVVTKWQESGALSDAWGLRPEQLEQMSPEYANSITKMQLKSYISRVPTLDDSIKNLSLFLGV